MNNEFWNGFYSGSLATLVGFLLTIAWDYWKTSKQDKRRDRAILATLKCEILENIEILNSNKTVISSEQNLLTEKKHSIIVLAPFRLAITEILRVHIPDSILKDSGILTILSNLHTLSSHFNDGADSRQAFKDNNLSLSSLHHHLGRRNTYLLEELEIISKELQKLTEKISTIW
jgi:hypothetical protein